MLSRKRFKSEPKGLRERSAFFSMCGGVFPHPTWSAANAKAKQECRLFFHAQIRDCRRTRFLGASLMAGRSSSDRRIRNEQTVLSLRPHGTPPYLVSQGLLRADDVSGRRLGNTLVMFPLPRVRSSICTCTDGVDIPLCGADAQAGGLAMYPGQPSPEEVAWKAVAAQREAGNQLSGMQAGLMSASADATKLNTWNPSQGLNQVRRRTCRCPTSWRATPLSPPPSS